jgi:serine/threonine protein kinase
LLDGETGRIFDILFVLVAVVPPALLSILILTKTIKSRVQLGSVSNRNAIEFLLLYSTVYGVLYLTADLGFRSDNAKFYITAVMVSVSFIVNEIFPFALYRTLLADTKFWRGLGRHNQMGINVNDNLRDSGVAVFRPSMDLSIISSTFQNMMDGIGSISVDFAYLQLDRIIGHGATSEVYSGRYRTKLVAIKLSNPPEITEEAIDVFVAEAKIASSLDHPNIVKFIGICVRPPQIAMVFEFCEGGNLKSNLQKNAAKWTPVRRIKACLDACNGVEAFHAQGLIHRDLKADNFFVGRKQIVKLGDFGESTQKRTKESTSTRRMSILGTVAFMAPELIAAERHYTEAIDVYALAITMWEIWTGKDPYEELNTFDIYSKVAEGTRPALPADCPPGFHAVLEAGWRASPAERPSSKQMCDMMHKVYVDMAGLHEHVEEEAYVSPLEQASAAAVSAAGATTGAATGAGVMDAPQLNPLIAAAALAAASMQSDGDGNIDNNKEKDSKGGVSSTRPIRVASDKEKSIELQDVSGSVSSSLEASKH